MTRKEIKKFYLSLIDNPDARWSKHEDSEWIYLNCRINNIRVECEENIVPIERDIKLKQLGI